MATSSLAMVTLTQPGSAPAEPGSSITLDCVVFGYNINDHHLHWVRQAPGKGLVWVTAFRTGYGTITANEFKGRVTPSTSGSTARLKLDRLTDADTATYYCARETHGFDPSIHTNINFPGDQIPSEPSVFIMKSENESIAACLAKDFYPKELKILMNSDSQTIYEETTILTSSGKYSAVKVAKLSSNELVSCSVQHNSKLINKTQTAEKPPGMFSGFKAE
uniref:Ig-like domain-containing protein n=1 Tax=Chelydra serpentina TaxID=8475 RepID=A0A8C3SG76_CHESE